MKKKVLGLTIFTLAAGAAFAQSKATITAHFTAAVNKNKNEKIMTITGTPAQKLSLSWSGSQFDTTGRDLYVYDAQKRLISDIEQTRTSGAYENKSKTISYFISTNNTNYLDSMAFYGWVNSDWQRQGKETVVYQDQSKGLAKQVVFGSAVFSITLNLYYDNNNFIKYTVTKSKITIPISLPPSDSTVYQTDGKGNPLTEDIYNWDNNKDVYVKSQHQTNTYDANNNLLVNTVQQFDTTSKAFVNAIRITNTYNSSNNVTISVEEHWDDVAKVWNNYTRTSTFYKNVTEYDYQLVEAWINGAYVNQDKFIWSDATAGVLPVKPYAAAFKVFPNPGSEKTAVLINLTASEHVNVVVLDVTGKQVLVLKDEIMAAGLHTFNIGTSNLAKGIYFVKLDVGETQSVQKLVIE